MVSRVACEDSTSNRSRYRCRMAPTNRLAAETSPYLRQHAENPVDWYAWGPEAFAAATERNVPILLSRRLLGLPLVPRDGPRVLRGRRGRRRDEPPVRQHQGRPRGAPRCRLDLHGRGAGDERPRWLADDGLPDARRPSLLRRHLLPEAELPEPDGRDRRRLGQPTRRHPPERRGARQRDRPDGADPAGDATCPASPSSTWRCSNSPARSTPTWGGFGARAEVPVDDEPRPRAARLPARARRTTRRPSSPRHSTRWRAAGCTTTSAAASPATRSTRSGSSPTSRRCSTTRRC